MAGIPQCEKVEIKPEAHHTIGVSQNYPVNIPLFLQKFAGDPAVKARIIVLALILSLLTPLSGLCAQT
jgi:hypothetical protein